jgi:hypothetical protein
MSMRLIGVMVAGACVSLAACSSGTSGPSTASGASASGAGLSAAESAKVETAAAVARELRSNPAAADEVLRRHGMTEQRFEELMYEIAEDPEMSEAYAKRVGG